MVEWADDRTLNQEASDQILLGAYNIFFLQKVDILFSVSSQFPVAVWLGLGS